jgi:II/X family phage/plasmid replication protein
MIDWVTAKMPCRNTLETGGIVKYNKDGGIEWLSQSWLPVQGSHDSNIVIKPMTDNTIQISGNPTKWLQGHNLFGTNDLRWLMYRFYCDLHERLCDDGLNPTMQQYEQVEQGNYTVSRVDVNETWHLANQAEVMAWIRSAGEKMALKRRGRGVFSGDTLYWGKQKKDNFWYLKCYSKGDEINSKKSNFPKELRTPSMLQYADKALRLEMTIARKALNEWQINTPCNWTADTGKLLLLNHLQDLEMSGNFSLNDDVLNTLPSALKMAYRSWLHGDDLRSMLPKNTFYRYRRKLKEYDIDIAMVRDTEKVTNNVVPLIKVLEAQPVGIPYWAFEQGLVVAPTHEMPIHASNDEQLQAVIHG